MANKITLITPPDIYENDNISVLFFNISSADQEAASKYLANQTLKQPYNFYVYSGETNMPWLLHSVAACHYRFIDLDNLNKIGEAICGYVLGKPNFYYKTEDANLAAIYSHINTNRVSTIENFLEKVLSE